MMAPIHCHWDGDSFVPLGRFAKVCDREFVVGRTYPLLVNEDRSAASHKHYFSSLHEAWVNLPEDIAERFPTDAHLRKYALIKAGYHDQRSIVCSSKAEAQRLAAFIKPMDDFAIVTVSESVVTAYTAKSQSMKAMGKQVFQESKDKVLEIAWGFCGLNPNDAAQHVGQAA